MDSIIGKQIIFKPEYQDAGDDEFIFRAHSEMENGRVTVICEIPGFSFPSISVAKDYMIESIK